MSDWPFLPPPYSLETDKAKWGNSCLKQHHDGKHSLWASRGKTATKLGAEWKSQPALSTQAVAIAKDENVLSFRPEGCLCHRRGSLSLQQRLKWALQSALAQAFPAMPAPSPANRRSGSPVISQGTPVKGAAWERDLQREAESRPLFRELRGSGEKYHLLQEGMAGAGLLTVRD